MEKLVRIRLPAIPRERAITTKGQSRALTLSLTRARADRSVANPSSFNRALSPPVKRPTPSRAHISQHPRVPFTFQSHDVRFIVPIRVRRREPSTERRRSSTKQRHRVVCVCRGLYPVWLPDPTRAIRLPCATNERLRARLVRVGSRARGDSRASVCRPGDRSIHPSSFSQFQSARASAKKKTSVKNSMSFRLVCARVKTNLDVGTSRTADVAVRFV